jgi:hypothetical protein
MRQGLRDRQARTRLHRPDSTGLHVTRCNHVIRSPREWYLKVIIKYADS